MLSKVKQITRKLYCIFDGITLNLPALNSENLFTPKIYKAVLFPVSLENLKKTFVIQGVYRLEKFVIMSNAHIHRFIPINGLKITPLLIPYPLNPLVESPRGK